MHNRFYYLVGAGLLISTLWAACTSKKAPEKKKNPNLVLVDSLRSMVQTGDLVARMGDDWVSQSIRSYSRKEKRYSHAGIALREGDQVYVVHIMPAKTPGDGGDTVRKEPLDSFLSHRQNVEIGLYRFAINEEEKKHFMRYFDTCRRNNVHFDDSFNIKSNTKMYCSEMIAKSLLMATANRINIEYSYIDGKDIKTVRRFFKTDAPADKIMRYPIVPIDHLYVNAHCKLIWNRKYDLNAVNKPDYLADE
jgi:hypothetical protein